MMPDEKGDLSVYLCASDEDRLEAAVALCDVTPPEGWPKNFDYVEFEDADLVQIGNPLKIPTKGETRCSRINSLHWDVYLSDDQRRALIRIIGERLQGKTTSRYTDKTIKREAPRFLAWLPPDSQVLKK